MPFVIVTAVGVVLALLGYKSFVASLSNFLDVLLVIFIPWSAVNLADYFVVRRGPFGLVRLVPDRNGSPADAEGYSLADAEG